MHRPIIFNNVALSHSQKTCFEGLTAHIHPGARIAIIGRNGSGKSSLLKMLCGQLKPSDGELIMEDGLTIGYVEQTIQDFEDLSGGQRLNKKLTQSLALSPDVLLLDEPTNHLDKENRKSLMRMFERYRGTLIIVSHDTELLRHCIDTIWHIGGGKLHQFSGPYDSYMADVELKRHSLEMELSTLKSEKKEMHHALMKEQKRAAKSKSRGQKSIDQRKWPTIVSKSKALRAEQTSGKKKLAIDKKKQHITEQLSELRLPEVITPTFSLTAEAMSSGILLAFSEADIGYSVDKMILTEISFSIAGRERVAICGKNASGKSTLLKSILGDEDIIRTGSWRLPSAEQIGYLDQHYSNLAPSLSVGDHIRNTRPDWAEADVRKHLNDFLFRKNEEVEQLVENLSGGEKARASLSLIAAKTPKLLLLDEITNNLDLETKAHVIQVLKHYPASMILVSHEDDFLGDVGVDRVVTINDGCMIDR